MNPRRLGDLLLDAQSGFASGDDLAEGGVLQVRMNNVETDGSWNWTSRRMVPASEKQLDRCLLVPGDVLFNATNSPELVGKSALFLGACEPVVFSNHFLRLRTDPDRLNPGFLAHWLRSQWIKGIFQRLCNAWVNQASVRKESLLELQLTLPSLSQQEHIAAILDKADSLRRKRQEAVRLADEFLKATFIDLFGDPVTNSRGWPTQSLESLGTLDRGVSKHRPRNDPRLLGGDYPLIQTGDVANCDGYVRTFTSTYSEMGLRQSKLWPAGTLCITIAANIAKTGILLFPACFPDSVVGFSASDRPNVEYVRFWLSFLQQTLEANAPASAQKNINLAILRELQIPVPSRDRVERFAAAVDKVEAIRQAQRLAVDQGQKLHRALEHALLTP